MILFRGNVMSSDPPRSGHCRKSPHMVLPKLDTLRIVNYPDPVLKKVCTPVTAFGPELRAFAERMLELMRAAEGIGLAAPQVGVPIRLFVWSVGGEPNQSGICVNPEFTALTGAVDGEEGCLSLPGVTVTMRRAQRAVMRAFDPEGNAYELTGEDLPARVWQHEHNHLDGRLIIDNMSTSDEIANRRAIKQLRAEYAPRC